MPMPGTKISCLLIGTCLVALVSRAEAQEAPAPAAGPAAEEDASPADIVVTARRGRETLLTVPVSVAAVGQRALVTNNVTSLTAVSNLVPMVTISKAPAGTGALFSIRGIGSQVGDPGVQQTVLVNFDNVLVNRGRMVNSGLYDLEQIEVLKGPQALFYGRNSTAGVISVRTASPGDAFGGYIRGGYEFVAKERYVDAALDVPVSDDLKVRIAGHFTQMDGWIKNTAQGQPNPFAPAFPLTPPARRDYPGTKDYGGRMTVVWSPTAQFNATLKVAAGYRFEAGEDSTVEVFCRPGLTNPSDFGVLDPQSDCSLNRQRAANAFPAGLLVNFPYGEGGQEVAKTKTVLSSLALHYDGAAVQVDAITGYYRLVHIGTGVYDNTSFSNIFTSQREVADSISEELRLTTKFDGPLNGVIGGYFSRDMDSLDNPAFLAFFGGADPTTGKYYSFHQIYHVVTNTYSLFGQARWKILDNVELDAGARYTHEHKSSLDGPTYIHPALVAVFRPANDLYDRTYSSDNVSPEVTLTWHPAGGQMIYAAYKTGYKSGAFSYSGLPTINNTPDQSVFAPEKSQGGEIGYKGSILSNRLSVQLTLYSYIFKNLQVSSYNATLFSFATGNAAKARSRGVEVQFTAQPARGLSLDAAAGYNEAEYLSFPNGPCTNAQTVAGCVSRDLSGVTLPRAPRFQANVGGVYDIPLAGGLKLSLNGRVTYSSSYIIQDNLDEDTRQHAFAKVDAGITLAREDDRWSIGLIGRNLTDQYVKVYSTDKPRGVAGEYVASMSRPREVALQAGLKF